MQFSQSESLLL